MTKPSDDLQFSRSFTYYLNGWQRGEPGNYEKLFRIAYGEIRRMAHFRLYAQKGHSHSTLDLAHDVLVRLLGQDPGTWKDKKHFIYTAARAMNQILIDAYRGKQTKLHGKKRASVEPDQLHLGEAGAGTPAMAKSEVLKLIDMDRALVKLHHIRQDWALIAVLKIYFGLQAQEIAVLLETTPNMVNKNWQLCKRFLGLQLKGWREKQKKATAPLEKPSDAVAKVGSARA